MYDINTGDRFGSWTILKEVNSVKLSERGYKARCQCGSVRILNRSLLLSGRSKSCGCSRNKHIDKDHIILQNAKQVWRMRYNDGDLSFEDFFELSQQNCHYCNEKPGNKFHIAYRADGTLKDRYKNTKSIFNIYKKAYFIYNGLDRLCSSKPHNKNNTVPCCKYYNQAKSDMSKKEFFNWIEKVYLNISKKQLIND